MSSVLATMLTFTTYGAWLRGDSRGWVADGIVYPADPTLEAADTRRMKHLPFQFARNDLLRIGHAIGTALVQRKQQRVVALTVRTWHVHCIVGATTVPIEDIVKCAKDAARYAVRAGRPIWAAGFDKRFCFDAESVRGRVNYVERHNIEQGWLPRPWEFIEPFDELRHHVNSIGAPGRKKLAPGH
jgi:hypothetical protein